MLDNLTLDQLRMLIAVAETGSFSAAARRLGRVQSAISQAIQGLEGTLQLQLFERAGKTPRLNDAGKMILNDARELVRGAELLRARAESIANAVEPELSLAVDSLFPSRILTASLKGLSQIFPQLPVLIFTEGLGAAEQRLRDGSVRLAIYSLLVTGATDLVGERITDIPSVPVVAADHPLARLKGPISRATLVEETQLVLTDRSTLSQSLRGNLISRRQWRFADLHTRLDYLLAGLGWCNMPLHLIEPYLENGQLVRLRLEQDTSFLASLYIVHDLARPPGKAGRWLIDDLKQRLAAAGLA
ncbi:MAG TPA: LysR family transcriptional regulator [Dongiaceae bacterium]|nr:LysR family transcriptional regulator [Dongiaceae bacterium]